MIDPLRRETGDRAGWRPVLPSRATYRVWFGLAAVLVFGMLAYLVWARARGLLSWADLWAIEGQFVIGGGISLAAGLGVRARWRRKREAVRAYERMLSSIAAMGGR